MDNALVIADQEVDAADMRLLQMLFKDSDRHLHTGYINRKTAFSQRMCQA